MKKLILSLALLGSLLTSSHAGGLSVSFGSSWDRCARPVYRPAYYYDHYDNYAPAVVYRSYPVYYSRPYYYQRPTRPIYGYSYPNSYRQGFRDGYSTAVRRAVPVFRAKHSNKVYR